MNAFRKSKRSLGLFMQVLLLVGVVFILIVGINNLIPKAAQPGQSDGYPPPDQANSNNATEIPYPGPYWVLPTPEATAMYYWPTIDPSNPPIDLKSGYTLSPSDIADYATYIYEQKQLQIRLKTPHPIPTAHSVPVTSLADLPQAIYNLPIVIDDSCIQAKNPGPLLPVKSLTVDFPDYFIIPFYEDNKLCATIMVTIKNGRAYVPEVSKPFGDVFPSVSAEEAAKAVTQKTGLRIEDLPILVYGKFREASTVQTHPWWQVKTTDGQVYYEFFVTAIFEGETQVETRITILNPEELHPIR